MYGRPDSEIIIFKGKTSQNPILIIASGTNRVNEKAIKEHIGEKLEKANADFVLEHTGFAIGGIPPVGHKNPIITFIDEDLLQHDEIWQPPEPQMLSLNLLSKFC